MKIAWIRAAERHFPDAHGAFGALLGFVDGSRNWHAVSTAPFNRDVEARLVDGNEIGIAPFPCRPTADGWMNTDLGVRMELDAVAWRPWLGGA